MNLKLSVLSIGLILLSAFSVTPPGDALSNTNKSIEWLSIEAAEIVQKETPKAIIVDVYTDWCKWCKVMDAKTFQDPKVAAYLNANFHMVKLNAEQKESIQFKGKTYLHLNRGRNGINELAVELIGPNMSYPSFVVLNSDLEKIGVITGFKDAEGFMNAVKRITADS